MNLPNKLTVARFFMAFAFVGLMSFRHPACHVIAYVVFIAAALTDYYDGRIARARNLITNFGKLLDPVADKVLVIGAMVILMSTPGLHIPAWAVVVIVAREFLITGARSLAATGGAVIGANIWGKTKAVIQMVYVFVFLPLAILGQTFRACVTPEGGWAGTVDTYCRSVEVASFWAAIFVALFTLYSGFQFMRSNWHALNLGDQL